jgi:hypothetical protein
MLLARKARDLRHTVENGEEARTPLVEMQRRSNAKVFARRCTCVIANRGFYPRHSTRWLGRNKPKRTEENRRALRPPPLPLLSPKPSLYYQNMDPVVPIPIASLLAGSVGIILSAYMVR